MGHTRYLCAALPTAGVGQVAQQIRQYRLANVVVPRELSLRRQSGILEHLRHHMPGPLIRAGRVNPDSPKIVIPLSKHLRSLRLIEHNALLNPCPLP
jgi:hypothetical protein